MREYRISTEKGYVGRDLFGMKELFPLVGKRVTIISSERIGRTLGSEVMRGRPTIFGHGGKLRS